MSPGGLIRVCVFGLASAAIVASADCGREMVAGDFSDAALRHGTPWAKRKLRILGSPAVNETDAAATLSPASATLTSGTASNSVAPRSPSTTTSIAGSSAIVATDSAACHELTARAPAAATGAGGAAKLSGRAPAIGASSLGACSRRSPSQGEAGSAAAGRNNRDHPFIAASSAFDTVYARATLCASSMASRMRANGSLRSKPARSRKRSTIVEQSSCRSAATASRLPPSSKACKCGAARCG